uniref:hypothetical protein n=1 Tax=Anaerolentibacter hominis TaxID=3079009 RepID=UPI0031B813DD
TIKRGSANVSIAEKSVSDDKTKVVFTTAGSIVAGEYTIAFGDKTATFTGVENKLTSIEISSDKLVLNKTNPADANEATVGYKALNQFGEDISAIISLTGNASFGTSLSLTKGTAKITFATGDVNASMMNTSYVVSLVVYDTTTGISTSANLTLSNASVPYEVETQGVYNEDGKALTATSIGGKDEFFFLFRVKDQYGNYLTSTDKVKIGDNLYVSFSGGLTNLNMNTKTLTTKKVDGITYFASQLDVVDQKTASAGTATAIIIPVGSGKSVTTAIEVGAGTTVATINVTAPANVKAGDSAVEFAYSAYDAEGNAVTDIASLNKITMGEQFSFVKTDGEIKLYYDASKQNANDYKTEAFVTPTFKTTLVSFTIKAASRPDQIVGLLDTDGKTALATATQVEGKDIELAKSTFKIVDQYGDVMKDGLGKDHAVKVTADTGDTFTATIGGAPYADKNNIIAANSLKLAPGKAKGSQTYTFSIVNQDGSDLTENNGTKNITAGSSYAVTFTVVASSQFKSYEVSVADAIYAGIEKAGTPVTYQSDVTVYGVVNSSTKVKLTPVTDYNFATGSKVSEVANSAADGKLKLQSGITAEDKAFDSVDTVEGSFTITMTDGTEIVTKVNVSKKAPSVASLNLVDENAKSISAGTSLVYTDLLEAIKGKDNYGFKVEYKTDGLKFVDDKAATVRMTITNVDSAKGKVTGNGLDKPVFTDFVTGDSFTVTFNSGSATFSTIVNIK